MTNPKMGRPVDEGRRKARALFPDWSDRTFARYWTAVSNLKRFGWDIGEDEWAAAELKDCIGKAARANGSLNVSKLERACEAAILVKIIEDYPHLVGADED